MWKTIRAYKTRLIATSVLTLCPIAVGAVLWGRLPDQIATHFNAQGVADGYSGKWAAVVGLPLFLFVIHWVCACGVLMDPKHRAVGRKMFSLTLWICPAVSLMVSALTYTHALGMTVDVTQVMMLFTGTMFVVMGNYLPKCRQNYTVGIKLPWTLSDEDNWNRTHRMAGPLWIAAGVILVCDAFARFAVQYVLLGTLIVVLMVPVVYSAALYLRKRGGA